MARRSQTDEQKQAKKLFLFHLECVRRNPKYKREYDQWVARQRPIVDSPLSVFEDYWKLLVFERPNPNERPDLGEIFQKGKLVKPLWGEIFQFPTNEMRALHVMTASPRPCKFSKSEINYLKGHLLLLYFPEEENNRRQPAISVVDMGRSKGEVIKTISNKINTWMKDRMKAGLKQEKADRRIPWNEIIKYLRAYDLFENKKRDKLTYEKIGIRLGMKGEGFEIAREAKRYVEKGKGFVENPPLLSYSVKDLQEKIMFFLK